MIRSIMASIFAVFLFMGIDTAQLETDQGAGTSVASLFVPAANAEEEDSNKSADSEENQDSEDNSDSDDATSTGTATGTGVCTSVATVQYKYDASKEVEKEKVDHENEAKEAKDAADAKKAEDDDDDSVLESEKSDDAKDAQEKDDDYEQAKKEHDDADSDMKDMESKLAVVKASASAAPCTTSGGQPGYWSNAAGTPVSSPAATTPKSMREVLGK